MHVYYFIKTILKQGLLKKKIDELFSDDNQIKRLEKNALLYSYPNATKDIWKEIKNLL